MVLTAAAASGLVVFLLSVPVVHGSPGWKVTYSSSQICAVIGSAVDMHCTFTYPPTWEGEHNTLSRTFWFRDEQSDLQEKPEYSGRVQYHCNDNDCTMTLSDLRRTDSDAYKFRFVTTQAGFFGVNGIALSVTDLQVEVRSSDSHLKCVSTCQGQPSYIWFKNGLNISEGLIYDYSGSFDPAGTYTCAVRGSEDFPSPPVYAPRGPSVLVTPSGDIMEGSSVNLSCSSDAKPAATYTWYKEDGNPAPRSLSTERELLLSPIQPSDSGEYCCTAENVLWAISKCIFVNVKYAPKLPSVSVSPSAEIMEGSSVNVTCSSDANPAANYTWYKENQTLFQGPDDIIHFSSISSDDGGIYSCKAENQYGQINSTPLFLDVQYAPKPPSVSVSPSAEIMEGSSVSLTCSSDANPAANYTWYKENQVLLDGQDGKYNFSSISAEDSGIYRCISRNQHGQINSSLFIDVQYPPKLPSVSVSPSAEVVEGSSVNVTCRSDANPAANYTWYKENQTLFQGPDDIIHFSSISSDDRGIYSCKAENKYSQVNSLFQRIDVLYAPKLPSVSACPSAEIAEGTSVILACSSDANPAATYTWYKEGEQLPKASGQVFVISDIRAAHSGEYYCKVQNSQGWHSFPLRLTTVATGEWKAITAGTIMAILFVAICVSAVLWMRKKCKYPAESKERPDQSAQNQPIELKDDLHYSIIDFSKKQADPLYSNTTATPLNHIGEEEVHRVEYAVVKYNSPITAPE